MTQTQTDIKELVLHRLEAAYESVPIFDRSINGGLYLTMLQDLKALVRHLGEYADPTPELARATWSHRVECPEDREARNKVLELLFKIHREIEKEYVKQN